MDYLSSWLLLSVTGLMATLVPGAAFAMVLRNSISISRQAGVMTAGGLAAGLAVHTSLVLFGVSLLIAKSALAMRVIQWGGALYLAYMGISSLRAAKKEVLATPTGTSPAVNKAFGQGVLTNLANPKAIIFSLALFSQFLSPSMPLIVAIFFAITLSCIEFGWFSIVALLLTQPKIRLLYASKTHVIERISGGALIILALLLLFTEMGGPLLN